jgi:HD-like signal output (HDOD) protein
MIQHQKDLIKIKNYIDKMPSLPITVTKIIEICNNPATSPVDLNKVIRVDPVLMGRVLKLINSAYYGLSEKVTSLVRAIIMLGINTVKNLALSTAVLDTLEKAGTFTALNTKGFWRHSLGVGVTAKYIAQKRGISSGDLEEYFITGLLHDIGKIPLDNVFPEKYIDALSESDRYKSPLYKSEENTFGFNHSDIGGVISSAWKLGSNIGGIIKYHHDPLEYNGNNTDVLFSIVLADYWMNISEIGFSGNRYPEKPHENIYTSLKVSDDLLDELDENVEQEIDKAEIFLNLHQKD